MEVLLYTILTLCALGVLSAVILYFVAQKFKVEEDPRIDEVEKMLPGANCGGCGYPGCSGYASAVVKGVAPVNACAAGGEAVAAQLGLDEVHAQLLPEDKVEQVEQLLTRQRKGEKLAFVGDGINDAPVLSRADIGIAMGSMGSDAAIEAADVVLMDDDPRKIASVVRISRKTLVIVKQNIAFALGVKAIVLAMGAFGAANMWEAVFADVGVSVIAIINAMRALKAE